MREESGSGSRLREATNPESGTVNYEYDENGNLKTKLDPRLLPGTSTRVTISYVYDQLNRVISRSYNDGTPTVTYTYDAPEVLNSRGRLTSVGSSVSSYSYGDYDAQGRVKNATQTTAGQDYLVSYEYNAAGALISQIYPSGRVVKTEYDLAGRIAGVKNNATGAYYAGAASTDATNRLQYVAAGAIQAMKLGNGLWEHTNFNSRLQPIQIGLGSVSTNSSILQLDYGYGTTNNNGNVQSQTIIVPTVGGVTGFTATQTYTYDSLNRLATAQENNGSSWKQNFDYGRYGNRKLIAGTTLPAALTPANNPTINTNNNRIDGSVPGQTSVTYDSAGNLTRDVGGHAYQYNAENKMVSYDGGATSGGGASYSYDGEGRRVTKVVGGSLLVTTVFVYDIMGQLVAEYSSSGSVNGGTSYVTSDTLGSPRVITGATQEVKGRHDYLPFGEELVAGTGGRTPQQKYGADNLRQKFTQYERDIETGLDFAQARYFSSTQGRFTSVDPLTASATADNPQSWNRYVYSLNSPLRFVDPTGLRPDDYYASRDGSITVYETPGNTDVFYVESNTTPGQFNYVAQAQRNAAGLVEFPGNGTGFDRYGMVDAGGLDRATGENVGAGDHFLQPIVAAALFGVTNVLNTDNNFTVSLGDMSSSNGSDPWQQGQNHHSGHGHNGNRSGQDIDFRYLNGNGLSFQSQTATTDQQFSRQNNQTVFDTAARFGFTTNYNGTNGPAMNNATRARGHNDHGHLGFTRADATIIRHTVQVNPDGTRTWTRVP